MKARAIESRIRAVAAFAEAGSDMEEKGHASALYEGARWILSNAKAISQAADVMTDTAEVLELLVGLSDPRDKMIEISRDTVSEIAKRLRNHAPKP